jgi:hypothetical protein
MERQEYDNKLDQLKNEFETKKRVLKFQFGMSQALYKIGDVIRSSSIDTTIEVERIKVGIDMGGLPYPYYVGHELKKDLTRKKNNSIGSIYGNDNTEKLRDAPVENVTEQIKNFLLDNEKATNGDEN